MKTNNNNRLYCHRKMTKTIKINKEGKGSTLHLPFDSELTDVYAMRLRDVYRYSVQYVMFKS